MHVQRKNKSQLPTHLDWHSHLRADVRVKTLSEFPGLPLCTYFAKRAGPLAKNSSCF